MSSSLRNPERHETIQQRSTMLAFPNGDHASRTLSEPAGAVREVAQVLYSFKRGRRIVTRPQATLHYPR